MRTPSTVDEYLAALPLDRRAVLDAVREAIRAAAPGSTETIAYQMPGFRMAGRLFVSYGGFRDHWSLFPASGGVRDALGEEFADHFAGRGTIRFGWHEVPSVDLVRRIVAVRLDEVAGTHAG